MSTSPPPLSNPVPAVQTFALTRIYGSMIALNALNLTVNRGDLFGFIGSNGAGKTTTLRILATFLAPSSGSARVLGHDVVRDADAVRHVIGYMPDFFGVYKDMEVTEYLDFFGACYKIPPVQGVRDQMASGRIVWVRVSSDQTKALEILKARPEITDALAVDGQLKVTLLDHETDQSIIADALVHGGARLIELREDELGLEE